MTKPYISLNPKDIIFKHYDSIRRHYDGSSIDRPLAVLLIFFLLPISLFNSLLALMTNKPIFTFQRKVDALNRNVVLRNFTVGLIKNSAVLFDILLGKIGFCGVSICHRLPKPIQFLIENQIRIKAGIFSLYDLHLTTGLSVTNKEQLLEKQLNGNLSDYFSLIIKSMLCMVIYGQNSKQLKDRPILSLFGLQVKNTNMKEAVRWITDPCGKQQKTKVGFFVNVHSVNLSINNKLFFNLLSKADALFADGSGIRLAATKAGYRLKGNNNGTDLLPHLCESTIKNNQSIYLLGSKPTIADKAAKNLKHTFPGLKIAGTQHGYSQLTDKELIENINKSQCDVLLVAMGSPIQEKWLMDNHEKLTCTTALAVGGLFDFYSGTISRSPLWLRQLGMEWLWRLIQEPSKKFNRYVIGTPLFLYRTYFKNLVHLGER
ncbi:MAG: WecB/TagA/CpsF family glycosyltransferase [Thalassotalea sp.]|nr:WecB/TagA/CpsF family glycosyltransferase [Thalassotalea sp.]